jgi:hypothetical protein
MDKTDISLILGAFSAIAAFSAPVGALAFAAFLAGILVGRRRRPPH